VTKPKKGLAIGAAICIGMIAMLVWLFVYRPEPVYQGKELSDWARQFGTNNWWTNQAAAREAERAIRAVGPEAIPFLLDWMQAKESATNKKLRELLPKTWHDRLRLQDTSGNVRRMGAHGIAALGTNAPPDIVPELIEIGRRHPDEDGRYSAVFALRNLGSLAEQAIPFYIECMTNREATIREEGAVGLGMVGRQPGVAVPALIKYLDFARTSINSFEARGTVYALRNYGTNAIPAVPLLISLLNHEREDIREAVTNSLPSINAEAARKANVKTGW